MAGRKRKKFSTKTLLSAIKGSGAIMATVASKLHCDWHTAEKHINENPKAKQAMEDEQCNVIDLAQGVLLNSIKNEKNTQDAKWYLAKKAKHLGYGDDPAVIVQSSSADNTESIKSNLDKLSPEERETYLELCEKINATDSE